MKKIILTMLLSVFLLSAMTVPILSQDEWTAGVNVGDWFLYEGTLVEYEADEGVPFPPHPTLSILETWNASDWQNYTVTAVSGTTVTFELVTHYKDGTEVTETFNEDIMSGPMFNVIGANLTVGDEVRSAIPAFGMSAMIINETIDWAYGNIARETNYCEWTSTYMGVNNYQTYYDKATGMRVKHVGNSSLVVAEGNVTCYTVHELIDTNLWECAQPQEWTVGLSVGDWFKYEATLVEYEADEGVPFPPSSMWEYLDTANRSDWTRRTVIDISGTSVTYEFLVHWKNGTETTSTVVDNIANTFHHFAIGANMEVGDEIAPSNPITTACIIDETIDIEYGSITRETNHASENWTDSLGSLGHLEWLWDKATGIQIKFVNNSSMVTSQGNATWLAVVELVDASVWVIPEFPTGTVMLLIFVAVTVCIDIYRRRKLKRHIG